MAGQAVPIVGRERELAVVVGALDDADCGVRRTLAIVGEPGIGKTRLLAELAAGARQRGHLVLPGRAAEMERDLPFGPFVDAADDYLASVEEQLLSVLGRERCRELALVFPALAAAVLSSKPSGTGRTAPCAG